MKSISEMLTLKSFKFPHLQEDEVHAIISEAANVVEMMYPNPETDAEATTKMYALTVLAIEFSLQTYQEKLANPLTELLYPK